MHRHRASGREVNKKASGIAGAIRACVIACVSACTAAPALADIVIGQVSPVEGYLGFYTRQLATGAQAAIQATNARGGILGQPLRLVSMDDQGDPQRSIEAYSTLAKKHAPVAFLYHVGPASIVRLLESRTLDRLQVPLLGTIPAIDPFRTPVRPYVFHLRRGDEPEIASIARHLVAIGLSRLSVLYLDDPAGQGAVPIVRRELQATGGTLVHTAAVHPGQDLSEEAISSMRNARAQATLLFMPAQTAGSVVSKLRQTGDGLPIYSVSYLDATTLVASAGLRHARGVAISQTVPNPWKSNLSIVAEYRRDMGKLVPPSAGLSPFSLEGYIAARVLIEAVRSTGKPSPTGRDVQAALERFNRDLGGLSLRFTTDNHVGLSFNDIAVVDDSGSLRY